MSFNRTDLIREAHKLSQQGLNVEMFLISAKDEIALLDEISRLEYYQSIHKRSPPDKLSGTTIAGIPVHICEKVKEGSFLVAVGLKTERTKS